MEIEAWGVALCWVAGCEFRVLSCRFLHRGARSFFDMLCVERVLRRSKLGRCTLLGGGFRV